MIHLMNHPCFRTPLPLTPANTTAVIADSSTTSISSVENSSMLDIPNPLDDALKEEEEQNPQDAKSNRYNRVLQLSNVQ